MSGRSVVSMVYLHVCITVQIYLSLQMHTINTTNRIDAIFDFSNNRCPLRHADFFNMIKYTKINNKKNVKMLYKSNVVRDGNSKKDKK